jgi:hypothetical protein
MPYVKNPIIYPSGKVSEQTAQINMNFSVLADAFYNSDPENSPIYRACYVGITAPLNPKVGQLWVDTSVAPPIIKVYNGTNWLEVKPASVDEPSSPYVGQFWLDTSVLPPVLKIYDGTSWQVVNAPYEGNTTPSSPYVGQFWLDTSVLPPVLKIYDGTSWQVVNAPYEGNTAPTNPYIGLLWLDTSVNPPILKIYDGINWQSNVSNANYASNAGKLNGQDGSYYLNRANHTGAQPPSSISPQGHGSGLNADKLDDQEGSYYLNRANHTGTQPPSTISPQGHGSGLDADTIDTFHASQTPQANTIPVADSGGKLSVNWIPLMFNSVTVITPSANTIYQETAPCLIMVVSHDFYGLQLSPNGSTWYGTFGQDHAYSSNEGGVITFYVPKGWYWRYTGLNNSTNSNFSATYWLKFVFNY